jgi:hypothetical protein
LLGDLKQRPHDYFEAFWISIYNAAPTQHQWNINFNAMIYQILQLGKPCFFPAAIIFLAPPGTRGPWIDQNVKLKENLGSE